MASLLASALRRLWRRMPRRMQEGLNVRRALWDVGQRRVGPYRRKLAEEVRRALGAAGSPSFFFLPTHSWHQASFQRPQQLARALGEIGASVVFAERMGVHSWSTVDEGSRNRDHGLREVSPHVGLVRLPEQLVSELIEDARPDFVVGYSALEQGPWLPESHRARLVYDVIDDERILNPSGDPAWKSAHEAWLERARCVLATADDIATWLQSSRPDVLLLRNGVRVEDWRRVGGWPVPDDMRKAREAPLVVYYHGILGDPWFDWDLWESCCRLRPSWAFVVIGWPRGETEEQLRARVARIPNGHYLGRKPHERLAAYLGSSDVAAVPFQVHAATHAASAIKVFEYFAAGKPVVSTPLREISRYRSILTADGPEAFVAAIERGRDLSLDAAYQRVLAEEAEANTWTERASLLRDALRRPGTVPS